MAGYIRRATQSPNIFGAADEDRTGIVDLLKRKPPKLAAVALATMLQAHFCADASWLIRRYSLIISLVTDCASAHKKTGVSFETERVCGCPRGRE
jgi:hypothetical protein